MQTRRVPKIAVWKFASCDGCQLSLLDCGQDFFDLAAQVEIADFAEASSRKLTGPYDLSIVEGSISVPSDIDRIREIRAQSKLILTIGACASAGGIQALRNFGVLADFAAVVYPRPEYIASLSHSSGIAAYVKVDYELRGCPVNKTQLMETVRALLADRRPQIPEVSVCVACKMKGLRCVAVSAGAACMGPVTQGGCDALCPAYGRGCFGCFGPKEKANMPALLTDWTTQHKVSTVAAERLLRHVHSWSDPFKLASESLAQVTEEQKNAT